MLNSINTNYINYNNYKQAKQKEEPRPKKVSNHVINNKTVIPGLNHLQANFLSFKGKTNKVEVKLPDYIQKIADRLDDDSKVIFNRAKEIAKECKNSRLTYLHLLQAIVEKSIENNKSGNLENDGLIRMTENVLINQDNNLSIRNIYQSLDLTQKHIENLTMLQQSVEVLNHTSTDKTPATPLSVEPIFINVLKKACDTVEAQMPLNSKIPPQALTYGIMNELHSRQELEGRGRIYCIFS